mmetsp:Transcript_13537/g.34040  ORF Transcript_13537/g.34040 Transcript_13537/m.34040 type:complete len:215 (+) Transcript_13537:728-1372(+)
MHARMGTALSEEQTNGRNARVSVESCFRFCSSGGDHARPLDLEEEALELLELLELRGLALEVRVQALVLYLEDVAAVLGVLQALDHLGDLLLERVVLGHADGVALPLALVLEPDFALPLRQAERVAQPLVLAAARLGAHLVGRRQHRHLVLGVPVGRGDLLVDGNHRVVLGVGRVQLGQALEPERRRRHLNGRRHDRLSSSPVYSVDGHGKQAD